MVLVFFKVFDDTRAVEERERYWGLFLNFLLSQDRQGIQEFSKFVFCKYTKGSSVVEIDFLVFGIFLKCDQPTPEARSS